MYPEGFGYWFPTVDQILAGGPRILIQCPTLKMKLQLPEEKFRPHSIVFRVDSRNMVFVKILHLQHLVWLGFFGSIFLHVLSLILSFVTPSKNVKHPHLWKSSRSADLQFLFLFVCLYGFLAISNLRNSLGKSMEKKNLIQ